jgi:hypothetical protein
MGETPRYFTLERANTVVALIRPQVKEILAIRKIILDRQPEIWPVVERAAGNGGNKKASQVTFEFQRMDALVREIMATGAILKDINTGLVDFPALREGREIYLCWKYGEGEVAYWHETNVGISERKSIDGDS